MTWHEGTTKRDADDICSAFIKWLQCQDIREKENLTVWLDNCNAQCKNWFIFTALVFFINSNATALKEIKLKYFEKGHTFMSADSYHHMVEKAMKDLDNVYDFEDWLSALNKNGQSIVLEGKDCWAVKKGLSAGKHTSAPYIDNIQEAKFSRGSSKLFWKNSMEHLDYSSGEFLQKK